MTLPLSVGGLRAVSVDLFLPWRGVWEADCELDLAGGIAPTGSTTLTIGTASYPCVVDPRGSGSFKDRAWVRLRGGNGGWDQPVPAKQFANGPISTAIYNDTAMAVGERVNDPNPVTYAIMFLRSGGSAARVFRDRDWYVDPTTGITQVQAWPAASLDDKATVLNFDATDMRVELASDVLVTPGTVFSDPRFNGQTVIARDVQQLFNSAGSTVTVWCASNPISRLAEAFECAVRDAAQTYTLRLYRYRFVLGTGNKLALQAITQGAPDLNPIAQWNGFSGLVEQFAPSTEIVVGFDGPDNPFIVSFSPLATPLQIDQEATTKWTANAPAMVVGNTAGSIAMGPIPLPLASGPSVTTGLTAAQTQFSAQATAWSTLQTQFSALAAASTGPLAPLAAAFTALATACGTANTAAVAGASAIGAVLATVETTVVTGT